MTDWVALRFQMVYRFESSPLKQFYYEQSSNTLNFGFGFNLSPSPNGSGGVDPTRVAELAQYRLQPQDPAISALLSTISVQLQQGTGNYGDSALN